MVIRVSAAGACSDAAPPENWYLPGDKPATGMGSDPCDMGECGGGTCAKVASSGSHKVTICKDWSGVQQWTEGGDFYHCKGAASGGWGVAKAYCCGLGAENANPGDQDAAILSATRWESADADRDSSHPICFCSALMAMRGR